MGLRALLLLLVLAIAAMSWAATCALAHFRDVAEGIRPLEPRSFTRLTAIAVGTGGAYENHRRLGPCVAVGAGDTLVLVDAGRAVAEGLRAAGVPVHQPTRVYLTSLLPQNVAGLDDLLTTGWFEGRAEPILVVGPPGTKHLVRALTSAYEPSTGALVEALELDRSGLRLEAIEIADGWSETAGELRVHAAALRSGSLEGRAYRFESGGRSIVVGGPGWDPDALVSLAEGADLLVHGALHYASVEMAIEAGADQPERLRREAALYTRTDEVGSLAARAGVRTLVLTRLRPPPLYARQFRSLVGETFDGSVVIAEDGETLTP